MTATWRGKSTHGCLSISGTYSHLKIPRDTLLHPPRCVARSLLGQLARQVISSPTWHPKCADRLYIETILMVHSIHCCRLDRLSIAQLWTTGMLSKAEMPLPSIGAYEVTAFQLYRITFVQSSNSGTGILFMYFHPPPHGHHQ